MFKDGSSTCRTLGEGLGTAAVQLVQQPAGPLLSDQTPRVFELVARRLGRDFLTKWPLISGPDRTVGLTIRRSSHAPATGTGTKTIWVAALIPEIDPREPIAPDRY